MPSLLVCCRFFIYWTAWRWWWATTIQCRNVLFKLVIWQNQTSPFLYTFLGHNLIFYPERALSGPGDQKKMICNFSFFATTITTSKIHNTCPFFCNQSTWSLFLKDDYTSRIGRISPSFTLGGDITCVYAKHQHHLNIIIEFIYGPTLIIYFLFGVHVFLDVVLVVYSIDTKLDRRTSQWTFNHLQAGSRMDVQNVTQSKSNFRHSHATHSLFLLVMMLMSYVLRLFFPYFTLYSASVWTPTVGWV